MKIVAANHADSLRCPDAPDAADTAVLDTVRAELRGFYGAADDALPVELAALAQRLDHVVPSHQRPA